MLVMVAFAPITMAPVLSVTVPLTWLVVPCARARTEAERMAASVITKISFLICFPSRHCQELAGPILWFMCYLLLKMVKQLERRAFCCLSGARVNIYTTRFCLSDLTPRMLGSPFSAHNRPREPISGGSNELLAVCRGAVAGGCA